MKTTCKENDDAIKKGTFYFIFQHKYVALRVEPEIYDVHHVNTEAAGFLTFRIIGFRTWYFTFFFLDPLFFVFYVLVI